MSEQINDAQRQHEINIMAGQYNTLNDEQKATFNYQLQQIESLKKENQQLREALSKVLDDASHEGLEIDESIEQLLKEGSK